MQILIFSLSFWVEFFKVISLGFLGLLFKFLNFILVLLNFAFKLDIQFFLFIDDLLKWPNLFKQSIIIRVTERFVSSAADFWLKSFVFQKKLVFSVFKFEKFRLQLDYFLIWFILLKFRRLKEIILFSNLLILKNFNFILKLLYLLLILLNSLLKFIFFLLCKFESFLKSTYFNLLGLPTFNLLILDFFELLLKRE